MKITPVNINICDVEKSKCRNFKAKFTQETLRKMAEVDKDPLKPTPVPYVDIFAISERIKWSGSKNTSIDIEEPREEILVKEEYVPQAERLKHYNEYGSFVIEKEYPAFTSTLKFTNPILDSTVGYYHLAIEEELDNKPYISVANQITSRVVEEGEANLLEAYIKDCTKYVKNVAAKTEEIFASLSKTDFNRTAINIVKNRLKH